MLGHPWALTKPVRYEPMPSCLSASKQGCERQIDSLPKKTSRFIKFLELFLYYSGILTDD